MKRLLTLLLTTLGVVALSPVRAQLTTDDHLTDFDFALRQVEANYAGFPSKMEAGKTAPNTSCSRHVWRRRSPRTDAPVTTPQASCSAGSATATSARRSRR